MNWYYADAGNQAGPVTDAELEQLVQAGKITANTLVWHEGMTNWRPFQEVAPAGVTGLSQPPLPPAPAAGSPDDLAAIQDRDYALDIGSCVTRSWQLVKGNFWPLIGATLLILILATAWNEIISLFTGRSMARLIEGIQHRRFEPVPVFVVFLSSLAGSLLYGILYGGLYLFFLKLIRGEAVNPGTLFAGFGPSAVPLLVASLLISLLTLLGFACCVLPGIYLSVSWLFTFPLIIDKRMDFWPAMELSRKLVTRHGWMVLGLAVVVVLVSLAGAILCCIGILVTVPISIGALMYAYEDIFGVRTP